MHRPAPHATAPQPHLLHARYVHEHAQQAGACRNAAGGGGPADGKQGAVQHPLQQAPGNQRKRFSNKPGRQAVRLPCEIALLMCDPEWQVTTGVAVFVFVHRPNEDFYGLMSRWRQTQLLLDRDYEWVMPLAYRHVVGDRADRIYPLFLLSERSPERLQRGLKGATLPYVVCPTQAGPPARFDPQVDHTPAPTTDLTREAPHPGPGRSARDAQPTSDPELEGDLWVE